MTNTSASRALAIAALATVTTLALAGCDSPLGRSGSVTDPVHLTTVWAVGPGGVGGDVLQDIVESTTGKEISLDAPVANPQADPNDDDGSALDYLRAGKADLGVVRADRLVSAGVTTLAPLTAPLVVTNNEQAAKIADDPISSKMMAGLDTVGLVGLAVVPGGLRHPFGYGRALLGPEDYRGAAINTRPGSGVDAMVTALGATTDHSVGPERQAASASGTLRGIEVSLQQSQAVDLPAVLTSNVTLYEKFDVVVIRASAWKSLSNAQQSQLKTRVAAGAATALAQRPDESAGFDAWCQIEGASAVLADPVEIAGIRTALDPVTHDLETGDNAEVIARMRSLHVGTTDPVASTCSAPAYDVSQFHLDAVGDQSVMKGTWRIEVSSDTLLAHHASPHDAQANDGVWTWVIDATGRGVVQQPMGSDCKTQFTFAGNRVSLDFAAEPDSGCGGRALGTWSRVGDTVRFTFDPGLDDSEFNDAFFAEGMVKIG
jgi:TRAP-type C4-dicarboxylate transport system substrate-binding protein